MKKQFLIYFLIACVSFGILAPSGVLWAKSSKVKIGVQPWLGYGPWWIAAEKGFFKQHNLEVKVVNFTWDADMGAAVASGNVQVIAAATNFLIAVRNQGIDLQGFLVLDAAYEADAILAPSSIKSIKDLKGKSVAYEAGSTSDLLVNFALKQHGMTNKDIKPVQMAAADAGLALIAGRVDIAVTYEPYISAALSQGKEYHALYTAAERPGLISDIALADRQYIEENPEIIKSLILAWDDAVTFLNNHPDEGGKIIADAVHSPMAEFKVAMEGVRVYDLKENNAILGGAFQKTMIDIGQIMVAINPKEIKMVPKPEKALTVKYIKELAK